MTFIFRRKNILPAMLLLSVVGVFVVCGGMGSPRPQWEKENAVLQSELKAEKSWNETLSREVEAAKNKMDTLAGEYEARVKSLTGEHEAKTGSLYFYLVVAIISGVLCVLVAINLGSDTRRKFQQMKRSSGKGGGDE